jgi:hypothetical protein
VTVTSATGNILAADGTANLTLTIRATDENGDPDNTAIDATATGGRFEVIDDVGTVGPDGATFSATPDAGSVTVAFFCTPQQPEQIIVQATNGNATGNFTVNCIEPPGTIVLALDGNDCEDLTASTDDFCLLTASLDLVGLDGSTTPQTAVNLTFEVTEVTSQQAEGPTDSAVLVAAPAPGAQPSGLGSDQISAVTNADGEAVIAIIGKDFDLIQNIELRVFGVAANGTQVEQSIVVAADPFENETDLVVPSELSVATGETNTITVSATDHQGNPDTAGFVVVEVDPDSGASVTGVEVDANGDLVDDGAGGTVAATGPRVGVLLNPGTFDFTAPDVTELTNVVVTVRYQPVDAVPEFVATTVVRVFPEGALILNAVANPQELRSDDNDIANVVISVERLQGGSLQPVSAADAVFEIAASDIERIGFGTRAGAEAVVGELDVGVTAQTDANGEASVQVSTTSDRIRGSAELNVVVTDPGTGESAEATVTLVIDRDPRLQSIVFISADPEVIGTRGGAFPSTSELTFQVFDDENQPLTGVAMDFDVNATADPEASVFAAVATTDAQGQAKAVLAAGTQAGPISVVATASFNGQVLVVESLPVVVTGGLPSFANSYIECNDGQAAQIEPFVANCTAVLVDRFTDRAPEGLGVHFRSEGGSITPTVVSDGEGSATALFVSNTLQASVASLLSRSGDSWSFGTVVPDFRFVGNLATGASFTTTERDNCYDGSSDSGCDVLGLCNEPGNELFCPLPSDSIVPGDFCYEHLNAFALTGDPADAGPELRASLQTLLATDAAGVDAFLAGFNIADVNVFNFFLDDDPGDPASLHEQVKTMVDAYTDNLLRCGHPSSCFTGIPAGLDFLEFDQCSVAAGCMDFDFATSCPQDGLRTVMAVVRGEESFLDTNGNGVFDFTDTNNNNRHDPGEPFAEPFIDMPEPYLDKNESCIYDDFNGSVRLQTIDELRHSDLFVDEDGSGDFGYLDPADPTGPRTFGNQQFDRDKQIFLTSHLLSLQVGQAPLEFGELCAPGQAVRTCKFATELAAAGESPTASCVEVAPGISLAKGCITGLSAVTLTQSDVVDASFVWRDFNGNCVTEGFASRSSVSIDGTANVAGSVDVPLDRAHCGFGDVNPNPNRPWCQDRQVLGAGLLNIQVTSDCVFDNNDIEGIGVNFEHTDAVGDGFSYTVDCALP